MKTFATKTSQNQTQMITNSFDSRKSADRIEKSEEKQIWYAMISVLIIFMVLILFPLGVSAQAISESFDGTTFLPTGWNYVGTATHWSRVTSATSVNPTTTVHSGAGMAQFDSYNATAGTIEIISTPVVDMSGRGSNTPVFSFYMYRFRNATNDFTADSIGIYINTAQSLTGAKYLCSVPRSRNLAAKSGTGNVTFTGTSQPGTAAWYQYTVTIPSKFNTATNYILIKGYSAYGYNIFLDDIQLTCATAAPGVTSQINYCLNDAVSPLTATGSNLLWYLAATGGTGTSTAPAISSTTAGTTSYWVSQTVGCESARAKIDVVVHPKPKSSVTSQTDITCNGLNNGTITVTASNGTEPYEFSLDQWLNYQGPTSGTTVSLFTGLFPDVVYKVQVRDKYNCYSK